MNEKNKNINEYTASSIKQLNDVDHIRKRPRRYLGEDVRTTAAREIFDNAADEVERGFAQHVEIIYHADNSIEVRDDGRGLPVDFDPDTVTNGFTGANGIVKTLGTAKAGYNFDEDTTTMTAGTNGEGAVATNAISDRMDVTVFRDGKMYKQQFRHGYPGHFKGADFDPEAPFSVQQGEKLTPQKSPQGSPSSGTWVRFIFDKSIASDNKLDVDGMIKRANIAARLRENMKLTVTRDGESKCYDSSSQGSGSQAVLEYVAGEKSLLNIGGEYEFTRSGEKTPATYSLSLAPSPQPHTVSSVNVVWTPEGGSFVNSALKAIGEGLSSKKIRGLKLSSSESYPTAEDFSEVSSTALAVNMFAPPFNGQEKRSLGYERSMCLELEKDITRKITLWASSPSNSSSLRAWAELALEHARAKRKIEAVKQEQKLKSRAAAGTNLSLPDKYLPCRKTGHGSGAELFICEGDSALKTIKVARDSNFQAAYPLRGKPLKTWNVRLTSARKNEEFSGIEVLLGSGIREDCDPEKCRFDYIILAADADPDGYNITSSLISNFVMNYRNLVEAGMLYISVPPLFVVTSEKSGRVYCPTEKDKDKAIRDFQRKGRKRISVQRCKGLGEMNKDDFRKSVMSPETRTLKKVELSKGDIETLEIVFGNSPEARRKWMQEKTEKRDADAINVMQ